MAEKHTPGPWRVTEEVSNPAFRGIICIIGHNGVATISVATNDGATSYPEEWEANARLIAAAPDLLAIAKRIEAAMDFDASDHPMFDGMQRQLLDAISKAEAQP